MGDHCSFPEQTYIQNLIISFFKKNFRKAKNLLETKISEKINDYVKNVASKHLKNFEKLKRKAKNYK